KIIQTRLKLLQVLARTATPFGKYDQRVRAADLADHQIDRALMDLDFLAVDQNRIKTFCDVSPHGPLRPIVLRRHRPSQVANLTRQARPEHESVEMTGMVGEIDPL